MSIPNDDSPFGVFSWVTLPIHPFRNIPPSWHPSSFSHTHPNRPCHQSRLAVNSSPSQLLHAMHVVFVKSTIQVGPRLFTTINTCLLGRTFLQTQSAAAPTSTSPGLTSRLHSLRALSPESLFRLSKQTNRPPWMEEVLLIEALLPAVHLKFGPVVERGIRSIDFDAVSRPQLAGRGRTA